MAIEFTETTGGDSGHYLKLKDRERVSGVFRGSPKDFKTHWMQGKPHPCTTKPDCPHCMAGDKARWRFAINFVTKEGNQYVAKIFEQGWTVWQQLKELNKVYELDKTPIYITRSGSDTDTIYSFLPIPGVTLTAAHMDALAKTQLHPVGVATEAPKETPREAPRASTSVLHALSTQEPPALTLESPEPWTEDLPF